jgi:hypothetical protein
MNLAHLSGAARAPDHAIGGNLDLELSDRQAFPFLHGLNRIMTD